MMCSAPAYADWTFTQEGTGTKVLGSNPAQSWALFRPAGMPASVTPWSPYTDGGQTSTDGTITVVATWAPTASETQLPEVIPFLVSGSADMWTAYRLSASGYTGSASVGQKKVTTPTLDTLWYTDIYQREWGVSEKRLVMMRRDEGTSGPNNTRIFRFPVQVSASTTQTGGGRVTVSASADIDTRSVVVILSECQDIFWLAFGSSGRSSKGGVCGTRGASEQRRMFCG